MIRTERVPRPPERVEGPTSDGGAYAIAYFHDDGSMEIVEFDANDQEIRRTYGGPAAVDSVDSAETDGIESFSL